jgi:prophage regulatory protein
MADTHTPTYTRLLRIPQVIERVGIKKTVIYDRMKAGTFPRPVKLGSASAWPENVIENWIAEQIERQRMAA